VKEVDLRPEGPRPDQGAHVLRRPRQREAALAQLADTLAAAPVQHIGKLLVLWRPMPEKGDRGGQVKRARKRPTSVKKKAQNDR
jgi:hypothetical protein